MTKTSVLCGFLAVLALPGLTCAQSPPAGITVPRVEPVVMTVDFGRGKIKVRQSHDRTFDPVSIPIGQQVTVKFGFLPSLAGVAARLTAMDGGDVMMPATPLIASDGSYAFQFRAGNVAGAYRFVLDALGQYEFRLYGFDPSNPPGRHR